MIQKFILQLNVGPRQSLLKSAFQLPNMGCIYMYGIAAFGVIVFGYALYSFITDELKRRKLAVALERLVYGDNKRLRKVLGDKLPTLFLMYFRRTVKKRAYDQGIGRHTQKEVTQLMTQNLKSVSIALGNKKYFGGDELCQEDCGIFGVLAQCLWGAPDSPYEELMNNECKNLKEYCLRVKDRVWPDWEDMLCK
ncbi:unnamed protein product [Orchesella dallaii]|uniref:Metaxin glutathione S-transferase domain-containing protein n=1 Tax=Orchesella dallaii TaxID=48710 RepID=A0ABP1QD21_9HEXA